MLIALLMFKLFVACGPTSSEAVNEKDPYTLRVGAYQDSMNHSFVSGANGVLLQEDILAGKQLAFYPVDSTMRFNASFERLLGGRELELKTNTDRLPIYRDFGILHFSLEGDSLQLHLYQSVDHPEYLFCPFKDLTNGSGSYGAGRYLDFSLSDTLDPILDFNLSYNPLCAYNHNYSCPIPPAENHLGIAVKAGVKSWEH